ncbi:glycosyltransferase family 4 protein [Cerasicoccus arenae]|uniref:Glycosyltransferase subfamily 4-like N-terminal domain-containing protein n=1 Tax=Cerasicoccus arenae TaxID=424488 RepID=A0A8J3GEL6_9BACT|nr:glycosyltransferase family 4 protein [Cerasicoccus arenae]MBK1858652.1 glycosyltransferase family 4 protein [Cerasicoccus arenae]GHC04784.1 hypothetical protein GCM10007047_22020 [Cerasicoccus arenae]
MRIWIVNPFDDIPGEGTPQRYRTLCAVLAQRGHEVIWWSSRWSHRRKQNRDQPTLGSESYSLRLIDAPAYSHNVSWARVRNHRQFARQLQVAGDEQIAAGYAPDLVLFSWPPMGTATAAFHWRERCGCRVTIDLMDAWPDNFLMLVPKLPGVRRLLRGLLQPWFRRATEVCQLVDAASAQSQAFADFVRQYGGPDGVHVCYLGASTQGTHYVDRPLGGDLRILYLGAMGSAYDLETLLYAISQLRSENWSVRLDIAGEGERQALLKVLCDELQLNECVTFHGYLQGQPLNDLLAASDVGVIPMLPDSLVAVPYKAGDYLGAGLPVINSLPGELKSLLESAKCGRFYQVGDAKSLANTLRPYAIDRQLARRERPAAKKLFAEHFDRAKTYPRWADWLERQVS